MITKKNILLLTLFSVCSVVAQGKKENVVTKEIFKDNTGSAETFSKSGVETVVPPVTQQQSVGPAVGSSSDKKKQEEQPKPLAEQRVEAGAVDPKPTSQTKAPVGEKQSEGNKGKGSSATGGVEGQDDKGIFASLGACGTSAIGGATAFVTNNPYTAAIGGVAIVAAVVWTVYKHKTQRATKTLEQGLDEFE